MKMEMTPAQALMAVGRAEFRSPTELEKVLFPGCESDNWLIANLNDFATAIIDGEFIEIYKGEQVFQFQIIDMQFIFKTARDGI
jgi:hypothetical protein